MCQFFTSTHYVIVQMRAQNNTKTAAGKLYSTLGTFKPEQCNVHGLMHHMSLLI